MATTPTDEAALTWRETQYGHSAYGLDGKARLFALSYSVHSRGVDKDTPWILRSDLPGYSGKEWKAATTTDAKGRAESLLRSWRKQVLGD